DRAPTDRTAPRPGAACRRRGESTGRECAWLAVGPTPALHRSPEAVRQKTPVFRRVPARRRRQLPLHGNVSSATTLQNTNRSTVSVYYRFDGYACQELEVIHYSVRRCVGVVVRTQCGTSLKSRQWMVQPYASVFVSSTTVLV